MPDVHMLSSAPNMATPPPVMPTDAAGVPLYYYETPQELADHPHQRTHQHNTLLGVLSRRGPDQKAYPNHPDCDISDNLSHYIVNLEVPGVKDPKSIGLNWISWRTLVITGTIERPWERAQQLAPADAPKDEVALEQARNGHKAAKKPIDSGDYDGELPPWLILGERKIGFFRRELHFPVCSFLLRGLETELTLSIG